MVFTHGGLQQALRYFAGDREVVGSGQSLKSGGYEGLGGEDVGWL